MGFNWKGNSYFLSCLDIFWGRQEGISRSGLIRDPWKVIIISLSQETSTEYPVIWLRWDNTFHTSSKKHLQRHYWYFFLQCTLSMRVSTCLAVGKWTLCAPYIYFEGMILISHLKIMFFIIFFYSVPVWGSNKLCSLLTLSPILLPFEMRSGTHLPWSDPAR